MSDIIYLAQLTARSINSKAQFVKRFFRVVTGSPEEPPEEPEPLPEPIFIMDILTGSPVLGCPRLAGPTIKKITMDILTGKPTLGFPGIVRKQPLAANAFAVLPEKRMIMVDGEDRVIKVRNEARTIEIDFENRVVIVEREDRTIMIGAFEYASIA